MLSATTSFSNRVDNVAADRPDAKGRMFSFCDSMREKSVVGVAVGGEDGRWTGMGEKRDSVMLKSVAGLSRIGAKKISRFRVCLVNQHGT